MLSAIPLAGHFFGWIGDGLVWVVSLPPETIGHIVVPSIRFLFGGAA